QADARLRAAMSGNAVDALNAESGPSEGGSRVSRVNRVPESSYGRVDPTELESVLGRALDQLDCVLRVTVPWIEASLWFVPSEADGAALVREGISRGWIWTVGELLNLLAVPGLTRDQARAVALDKLTIDGEVAEVRPSRF